MNKVGGRIHILESNPWGEELLLEPAQHWLAWGAFDLVTGETGPMTRFGDR